MSSDAPATLGEYLRQERERRGITIEQVASATKISVRLLHAIESDHYAELPAKPFVRGFVTSYARFVGLDPHEILTRFGDFIDKKATDRPRKEGGHSGYAFEPREGEQSRTVLWIVMGVFVLLGGVFIAVFKPVLKHRKSSHVGKLQEAYGTPSPSPSPAPISTTPPAHGPVLAEPSRREPSPLPAPSARAPAPSASPSPSRSPSPSPLPSPSPSPDATPTATPSPSASPSVSPTPSPKPDPLNSGLDLTTAQIKQKVVFKALADVWVRYQVDGKPMMRFILRKDRLLVLRARERIGFQVSNPKSVQFNYGNRGFKLLASEKSLASRPTGVTIFFTAPNLVENIADPFEGERPLPSTPSPDQPGASEPSVEPPEEQ